MACVASGQYLLCRFSKVSCLFTLKSAPIWPTNYMTTLLKIPLSPEKLPATIWFIFISPLSFILNSNKFIASCSFLQNCRHLINMVSHFSFRTQSPFPIVLINLLILFNAAEYPLNGCTMVYLRLTCWWAFWLFSLCHGYKQCCILIKMSWCTCKCGFVAQMSRSGDVTWKRKCAMTTPRMDLLDLDSL